MNTDTELVSVSSGILSSYGDRPLASLAAGRAPRDVAGALASLCTELPWLRITELWRSTATQAAARQKYLNWVSAGKPKVGASGFDARTMKADFVAKPGKSMHNAGRAIDVNVATLQKAFGKEYLDTFWPIATRYGFTPVLAKPTEGTSESWHFDHREPWDLVGDTHGYETMALCAALVVGEAGEWQSDDRIMQALLLRAGWNLGEPDGVFGPRSRAALQAAIHVAYGTENAGVSITRLRELPASTTWKAA